MMQSGDLDLQFGLAPGLDRSPINRAITMLRTMNPGAYQCTLLRLDLFHTDGVCDSHRFQNSWVPCYANSSSTGSKGSSITRTGRPTGVGNTFV